MTNMVDPAQRQIEAVSSIKLSQMPWEVDQSRVGIHVHPSNKSTTVLEQERQAHQRIDESFWLPIDVDTVVSQALKLGAYSVRMLRFEDHKLFPSGDNAVQVLILICVKNRLSSSATKPDTEGQKVA